MARWGDPVERFSRNVQWAKGGCLLWTAFIHPKNKYAGSFRGFGRHQKAHKWIYETLVGPVPKGLDLDHTCRIRHCVNINHLEPVPRKVNVGRGIAHRKCSAYQIVCKRGHWQVGDTVMLKNGKRVCRTCRNLLRRDKRHAKQQLHSGAGIGVPCD